MSKSISAHKLLNIVASGNNVDLIDVRTPIEFRAIHVTIARNEPLDRLDPKAIQSARNGSSCEPLYVVCRSGGRSNQACEKFFACDHLSKHRALLLIGDWAPIAQSKDPQSQMLLREYF